MPINKIIELNPPTEIGLEIGTSINVPIRNNKRAESRTEQEEQLLKPESESDVDSRDVSFKELDIIRHTVETKQTLFSISGLYGVTIEEVRNWNNLSSNSLTQVIRFILWKPGRPCILCPKGSLCPLKILKDLTGLFPTR